MAEYYTAWNSDAATLLGTARVRVGATVTEAWCEADRRSQLQTGCPRYRVVQITDVERPVPRDYVLVWENTGSLWTAARYTADEAEDVLWDHPELMVMRLVPANDTP